MLELRLAFRRLRKSPFFSAGAVAVLALGIGAATLLFAILDGAILKPWPYEGFGRIVTVRASFPRLARENREWSVPEVLDLLACPAFDGAVAGRSRDANLTGGGRPERVHAVSMTASGWAMLGARPAFGRLFSAEEDRPGAALVAVMSDELFRTRFGAEPSIVGKTLLIDGQAVTIVGVMPPRFVWWGAELWFPLAMDTRETDRGARRITVQGRLRPGMKPAAAAAALDVIGSRWENAWSSSHPEYRGIAFHALPLVDDVLRGVPKTLGLLFAAVALVLLVASANLGNLLLTRASARRGELALRVALGASAFRVARELAIEAALLAAGGAALGVTAATILLPRVLGLLPLGYVPAEADVRVNAVVALFACGAAALAALLVSILPAREALRANVAQALNAGARAHGGPHAARSRRLLVAVETGLALLVLAAASVAVRGLASLLAKDPGFVKGGALTFGVGFPQGMDGARSAALVSDLGARLAALPGVEAAGASSALPLSGWIASRRFSVEGRSDDDLGVIADADVRTVTPGYFAALGARLLDGRDLSTHDGRGDAPAVLVNEALARRFLGGRAAAGRRLKLGAAGAPDPWMTVVGVVSNVKERDLATEARPTLYLPYAQRPEAPRAMTFVVRSSSSDEALADAVRRAVAARDPELPVMDVTPLSRAVSDSLGPARLALVLLGFFAATAVVLSSLGLFAVLAASVQERTREMGLRVALGARPPQIFGLVLSEGLTSAALGLGAGLVGSSAVAPLVDRVVSGTSSTSLAPFAAAAILLFVSAAACALPALRAMRLSPAEALRSE